MSLLSRRYSQTCFIVLLLCIVLVESHYRWPFKAINVEIKLKGKQKPCFASFTWVPPAVVDKCDESLLNSKTLHKLPFMIKEKCMQEDGKQMAEINMDRGTLYEYLYSVNPERNRDRVLVVMSPIPVTEYPPTNVMARFLKNQYSLRSPFHPRPPGQYCKDELNRDYDPVRAIDKCVFMQVDTADGTLVDPTKKLPTEPRQITKHLTDFYQHAEYDKVFDFLFQKSFDMQKDVRAIDVGCVSLMRIVPGVSKRLVICRYNASDNKLYQNTEKLFFCGEFFVQSAYDQYIISTSSTESKPKEFYAYTLNDEVKFTENCYSEITLEPDATNLSPAMVHIGLFVRVKPSGESNHVVYNQTSAYNVARAALLESLTQACPFSPRKSNHAQKYSLGTTAPTKNYFQHFAGGSATLATIRIFKPCYFQFDIGKKFTKCIRYLPLKEGVSEPTGGFQVGSELEFSSEKNGCRMSIVRAYEKCTQFDLNQNHLALICPCNTQYCDKPSNAARLEMLDYIRPKVCAVRDPPSEDDEYDKSSDKMNVACYFIVTLLDGRPHFSMGVYSFEMAKREGLPFENCVNQTLSDKDRCIIRDSRQLCCCQAEIDLTPCNSVEAARNRHATSKLRNSARCSTYLHLNDEDKAACNVKSSKMRICVSVYDVVKSEETTMLQLSRETCESESNHKPFDMAMLKCHGFRRKIVDEESNECVTILIEDSGSMTVEEAALKVVSCCPPEAYTTARDSLKEFTFKSISDFT